MVLGRPNLCEHSKQEGRGLEMWLEASLPTPGGLRWSCLPDNMHARRRSTCMTTLQMHGSQMQTLPACCKQVACIRAGAACIHGPLSKQSKSYNPYKTCMSSRTLHVLDGLPMSATRLPRIIGCCQMMSTTGRGRQTSLTASSPWKRLTSAIGM